MSNMTEYELHTQGACHCIAPAYDGRDPMRNRPLSNGTDNSMSIQRYGLGREYAGNTGSPAITEQADGAYVRYEDFQRMEAAHKAHNEMLVLRTKKAESAQPSERTNRDYAIEHAEYLAKAAERFIEAVCSHSQAVMEHDEQDTMETAKAADDAAESTGEAMTTLRSMIYEFRKRRDRATPPAAGQAQQESIHLPQLRHAIADNTELRQQIELMKDQLGRNVWLWEPEGENHLESMGNRMGVLIYACHLKALLAQAQQDTDKVDAQPGDEAKEIIGLVDTLIASVNDAHHSNRDDWRDACFQSADQTYKTVKAKLQAHYEQPVPAMAGDTRNALEDALMTRRKDFLAGKREQFERVQPASGEDEK